MIKLNLNYLHSGKVIPLIFKHRIFAVLVFLIFGGLSVNSVAAEDPVLVSCTNYNDPDTCTFTPEDSPLAQSVTGIARTIDIIDQCTQTGDIANCNIPVDNVIISVSCIDNAPASPRYSCQFDDLTVAQCEINGTEADCSITTDRAQLITQTQGLGLTVPQTRTINVLIEVCTTRNVSPRMQRDCDFLMSNLTAANISEITPDGAAAPLDASQTSIRAQNINIGLRMAHVRKDPREKVSFNGLQIISNGQQLSKNDFYPDMGFSGGGASADETNTLSFGRLGVFVNGTINVGEKDTSINERGFDFTGMDLTGGVDYRYTDIFFTGLAFGLANSKTNLKDKRGVLDLLGINLILYGSYYPSPESYIDGSITIGGNNYEQERNALAQIYLADYFGMQSSANISGGYDFVWGSYTLSPFAQLQYISSDVDEYSEHSPGGGFSLRIDGQDVQSTTLAIGGQFSYAMNNSWGVMVPQLRLEMVNEFNDSIHVVEGHFIGDPSQTKFRLPTNPPDDNYFNLGLGSSAIFPDGTTGYFFYQTQLGFDNLSTHSFNIGGRWEF